MEIIRSLNIILLSLLLLQAPVWAGKGDEKPNSHAHFVSRFLGMVKDKFSVEGPSDAEVDSSRRGFLVGSGAAILTAGVGSVGGLAKISGIGGLPQAWLQRVARIRSSNGLDAGGLENYIRVLEQEMSRVTNPSMKKALKVRIAHAKNTIVNIDALKDKMSLHDTREVLDPSNLNPHRLRRLRENLNSSRERVLQNSRAESTLIESILEAETLLSPLLRNRLNVQVAYTHPLRDEYVIALNNEDEKVVEEYLEMLWTIQEWMESYPDTANRRYLYTRWLHQRVEFADHALRALRTSKRHLSCEDLVKD